jgi:hypothetical protein
MGTGLRRYDKELELRFNFPGQPCHDGGGLGEGDLRNPAAFTTLSRPHQGGGNVLTIREFRSRKRAERENPGTCKIREYRSGKRTEIGPAACP